MVVSNCYLKASTSERTAGRMHHRKSIQPLPRSTVSRLSLLVSLYTAQGLVCGRSRPAEGKRTQTAAARRAHTARLARRAAGALQEHADGDRRAQHQAHQQHARLPQVDAPPRLQRPDRVTYHSVPLLAAKPLPPVPRRRAAQWRRGAVREVRVGRPRHAQEVAPCPDRAPPVVFRKSSAASLVTHLAQAT